MPYRVIVTYGTHRNCEFVRVPTRESAEKNLQVAIERGYGPPNLAPELQPRIEYVSEESVRPTSEAARRGPAGTRRAAG